jgi:hypothetical protein
VNNFVNSRLKLFEIKPPLSSRWHSFGNVKWLAHSSDGGTIPKMAGEIQFDNVNPRRWTLTVGNLILVLVGSLPIIATTLIGIWIRSLRFAEASILGFCPLDFLEVNEVPSPVEVQIWACVLATVAVSLGILGLFKTPAALLYVCFVWGSAIVFAFRIMVAIQGAGI